MIYSSARFSKLSRWLLKRDFNFYKLSNRNKNMLKIESKTILCQLYRLVENVG